jgi:glyoxylase-like metal-dependent hydrolase (beta-lactamase superfamily II)
MSELPEGTRAIDHFRAAFSLSLPAARLEEVRRAAPRFREEFAAGGTPLAVRTLPLVAFPYPRRFALGGAALHPAPYVTLTHRSFLVRYRDWEGAERILLYDPADLLGARHTPFFAGPVQRLGNRLAGRIGARMAERLLTRVHAGVEQHLARRMVLPEEVDFLAYDHLHAQDVRRWIGTTGPTPGRDAVVEPHLPKARLLVPAEELAQAARPHPLQAPWYPRGGVASLPAERVVELHGSLALGPGVALLSTPGHTLGSQSLALHLGDGRVVCISGNGVAADSWAPRASRIPGLSAYARRHEVEVIPNANTLEASLDQYTSMVLEKLVAGPSHRDGEFFDVLASSELTPSPLAPALAPTFSPRLLEWGDLGPERRPEPVLEGAA